MRAFVFFVLAFGCPTLATATEPPKKAEQQFKNIQSFKGMPAHDIDPAMEFMSRALGVGCEHCHVSVADGQWPMEKDDKQAKRTTRKMIAMQQRINRDFFGGHQEVTCATCHAGRVEPLATPPMARHEEAAKAAPAPASVRVDEVLQKFVTATGGKPAWDKLKTRVSQTTFVGPPTGIPLEVTQLAPDRWLARMISKHGSFEQGFDGKSGWQRSPRGDVHDLGGSDLADARRDAPLALPLVLPSLVSELKVIADALVGKGNAHVLEGTSGDVVERLYFDDKSGLLVRWSTRLHTPLGDLPEETSFEDYRKVDGVMLPFTVVRNIAGEAQTIKYQSIKHNVPVDEAQFARPAATPTPTPKPAATPTPAR
ncbi:MAG: hypothetical protein JWN44_1851 [Myxococcales bacterium]|nr:hypothetical protein [Myxococcales bacterium]